MQNFGFKHNIQYYEGKLATVYCVLSSKARLFGQAPSEAGRSLRVTFIVIRYDRFTSIAGVPLATTVGAVSAQT